MLATSRRSTLRLSAVTALAGLALTGCATGRHAEVLKEHTVITGANVDVPQSSIVLRNVYATPTLPDTHIVAAGGALVLHATVVNSGSTPDSIVAASTGTTATPTAIALPAGGVPVGAHSSAIIGGAGTPAVTWPVTANLLVGTYVPVTLHFASAGTATITVPVEYAPTPAV